MRTRMPQEREHGAREIRPNKPPAPNTAVHPARSEEEVLGFLATMLADLRQMAGSVNQPFLALLIDMAIEESNAQQYRHKDKRRVHAASAKSPELVPI